VGFLLLALLLLPLLDLYLLVQLGQRVGALPVLAFVVIAGVIGGALARAEGFRVFRRWRESVGSGQVPEEGLLGGVLVVAGGVLMVLPGFITDVLGLVLVLPPTRRLLVRLLRKRVERSIREGRIRVVTMGGRPPVGFDPGPRFPSGPRPGDDVVDGEVADPPSPKRPTLPS
jgi:UPF0716 protein FxsA